MGIAHTRGIKFYVLQIYANGYRPCLINIETNLGSHYHVMAADLLSSAVCLQPAEHSSLRNSENDRTTSISTKSPPT